MKTLLLLRHGKSDWQHADIESDYERPLAPRGVKAAKRMAEVIEEHDLIPELIISSPAKRALTTARLIETQIGDVEVEENEDIYDADLNALLNVVHSLPDDVDRIMLVGHNPGFEDLTNTLSGREDTVLKTCNMAILNARRLSSWAEATEGTFELEDIKGPGGKDED
ncbi:histidine phosphatase family protein [bacterium]|nr:histidine phosphatase family protein [bacterium]